MSEYVVDEYVEREYVEKEYIDGEYLESDPNVRGVLSSAERDGEVSIDRMDGWPFDTRCPAQRRNRDLVRSALRQNLYAELSRNSMGGLPSASPSHPGPAIDVDSVGVRVSPRLPDYRRPSVCLPLPPPSSGSSAD